MHTYKFGKAHISFFIFLFSCHKEAMVTQSNAIFLWEIADPNPQLSYYRDLPFFVLL